MYMKLSGSKWSPYLMVLLVFLPWLFPSCKSDQEKRPNVMIIFPDQFRQYSLGFWSQSENHKFIQGNPDPVVTPALDKLASQSIVFSRAVSNFPLCSPYRGMLLSGMYPDKNGLWIIRSEIYHIMEIKRI